MTLDYNLINKMTSEYGDSLYLLDKDKFEENYNNLLETFQKYYRNTCIAYSYKTNYLPVLCNRIQQLGGYAEIVSEMELYLAEKLGIPYENIYYNGPWKKREYVEKMLLEGGHINIDGFYEVDMIIDIVKNHPDRFFKVGLRIAGDIGQEEPSRFGFCVENGDLLKAYDLIQNEANTEVNALHLHLPYRMLDTYSARVDYMKRVLNLFPNKEFDYISFGGGYMGEIPAEMKGEFSFEPPTFDDYAKVVAGVFADIMSERNQKTALIIEPGSALVANCMKLVTKVINIKESRGKYIATLSGSTYQMNPSVKDVKRSIKIHSNKDCEESCAYESIDMAGYTCIEGDYLYRNFKGYLNVGDYVIFDNVGSYSLVMKPPFILPDIPVISLCGDLFECDVEGQKSQDVFDRLC